MNDELAAIQKEAEQTLNTLRIDLPTVQPDTYRQSKTQASTEILPVDQPAASDRLTEVIADLPVIEPEYSQSAVKDNHSVVPSEPEQVVAVPMEHNVEQTPITADVKTDDTLSAVYETVPHSEQQSEATEQDLAIAEEASEVPDEITNHEDDHEIRNTLSIDRVPADLEEHTTPVDAQPAPSQLEDLTATPTVPESGAAGTAELPERAVSSLQSFTEFIDRMEHAEPAQTAIVVEKIEEMHEITQILMEAELLDGPRAIEKTEVQLVHAFEELLSLSGVSYEKEEIKAIVHLWIEHDVLNSSEFAKLREDLFVDDGMHEAIQHFLASVTILKHLLQSTHQKIGSMVVAALHGLEPAMARH